MVDNVDDFLAHHGVKGMKWGVTKADYRSMSKDDRKGYRKKSFKERSESFKTARDANTKLVAEVASKNGKDVLVKTRLMGDTAPTVMLGSEFAKHLANRGVFDANMTSIVGYKDTPAGRASQKFAEGQLDKIWAPTAERYVRKD